ncbi:hypothetical protein BDP27DRAFT_1432289 [Rhodocollybia butyracea]|uniref:Uncharacterized protein n=1 Tax=Rhodocollybia butyracea TaxID=206335 RepID=A0A9P5PAW8_9AGAR|nr:hypothetical protein BDP27DRAFT_1432289 [Rhodocollybia butyracea]
MSAHNEQLSAPPASGKTCFLDDFKRYVKPKRYHYLAVKKTAEVRDPATYYNCASKEYNELDLALEGLNQKGLDPLWVFLDEAQETYSFSRMWVGFRNAKLSNANVRVMAVGVYTRSLLFDHNVALPRENRMKLYHSKISSWPHLAFSEGERKAYLKKADIEYPAELETHLIAFGQGHPCIFTKYLTFVVSKAAGDGGAAQFNLSSMPAEFQKLVKEDPDLQRSLPPFDIPPAVRAVLTTVLAKGSVTFSHLPRLPGACVIVERQDIEWYLEGKLGSGLPDPQGLLDPLKSPRHVYRESETTLDSLTRITLVPATDVQYNYIKELLLSPKIPELLQNLT